MVSHNTNTQSVGTTHTNNLMNGVWRRQEILFTCFSSAVSHTS